MRADKALLQIQLAKSRTHAQDLISEGVVFASNKLVKKASEEVNPDFLEVRKDLIYVSRGAYKLESAAKNFNLDFVDKIIADVGASTGGFTDYCLRNGASKIYAIDVGHDQLAPDLRSNEKVINLEGINIKNGYELPEKVDLIVADLSFISLKLVVSKMMDLGHENSFACLLVKPQFEVGKNNLGKGGIVKSLEAVEVAILDLYEFIIQKHFTVLNFCQCGISGKDGNQEYFFFIGKNGNNLDLEKIKNLIHRTN